ncbi:MAG: DUF3047 domain-containing protein [Deltaproteobacteria bacterium]|jgi:hypothetical protein|nr:DUF3047 domain-containing protein [Deltaproteobacteria bacterium]MBT4526112.1 DUF3047 domain-containing protein [Deltaproteobacteria bacterium]
MNLKCLKNFKCWFLLSSFFYLLAVPAFADQYLNLNEPNTWKMKQLVKTTAFNITLKSGEPILTLESKHSAGLFYRMIDIDLKETPYLNWSWKVNHIYKNYSENQRSGDDFPARVLIVYEEGFVGTNTTGFSFVWASQMKKGSVWKSPVGENLLIVANQSGDTHINQWLKEKVDLKSAFKNLLKKNIERVSYIALMADSDDLEETVTTQFKNIYFSRQ